MLPISDIYSPGRWTVLFSLLSCVSSVSGQITAVAPVVREGNSAPATAEFSYQFPGGSGIASQEWAVLAGRLAAGRDFTPAGGLIPVDPSTGAGGTVAVSLLPDLRAEEDGTLSVVVRPSSGTWAQAMSAPTTVAEFSGANADAEVLYWEGDLVVSRRVGSTSARLEIWQLAADGTLSLDQTISGTPDSLAAVFVSRWAIVALAQNRLSTWLHRPDQSPRWVKQTDRTMSVLGPAQLCGDRMIATDFTTQVSRCFRVDPSVSGGWRPTGRLGIEGSVLALEDDYLIGGYHELTVWDAVPGEEDVWKPVYSVPSATEIAGTGPGIFAVSQTAGVEIHERGANGDWRLVHTLPVPKASPGQQLSVAFAGDWIAVGKGALFPDAGTPAGTIRLFLRDRVDRSLWNDAGTLTGPGTGYGRRVLWNGRDLISFSPGNQNPDAAVRRRFAGAEVLVRDDDRDRITLPVFPLAEPRTGPETVACYAEIALPASTALPFSWEITSANAVPGVDFDPATGTGVIPAGATRAVIPVTLYADQSLDPAKTLTVRVSDGTETPVEGIFPIRDAGTPPLAVGEATLLLEGYGSSTVSVRQVPVTGSTQPPDAVDVGVRTSGFADSPPNLGIASHADLPTLQSTVTLTGSGHAGHTVTATQDEEAEPAEETASAVFTLPQGRLSAGSLGVAVDQVQPAIPPGWTGNTGISSGAAAADWVFLALGGASGPVSPSRGVLLCYQIVNGGLELAQQLPLEVDPQSSASISATRDHLAVSSTQTIAEKTVSTLRLYRPGGPAGSTWTLERTWYDVRMSNVRPPRVRFSGDRVLTWEDRVFERTDGPWAWRQILDVVGDTAQAALEECDGEWALLRDQASVIKPWKRRRGQPWVPGAAMGSASLPPRTAAVRGATLFLTDYTGSVAAYRETPAGAWQLEQTLPGPFLRVVPLSPSSIACGDTVFARTGSPAEPWVALAELPSAENPGILSADNTSILQTVGTDPFTKRLQLLQPGTPLALEDDDSLIFTVTVPNPTAAEADGSESIATGFVSVNRKPPFPMNLRVRSRDTGSATEGADYVRVDVAFEVAPGRVSPPFSTGFPIRILPDSIPEGYEEFELHADPPVFGRVGPAVRVGISDPRTAVAKAVGESTRLLEPASGPFTQAVEFLFPSAAAADQTFTVTTAAGGSATEGADFTLPATLVSLPAGENRLRVPVRVAADALDEPRESFTLTLTNALAAFSAEVTIDDAQSSLLAPDEYNMTQGGVLTADGLNGHPAGLLANDPAPPPGEATLFSSTAWGGVVIDGSGSFTATPGPNTIGDVLFSYRTESAPVRLYADGTAAWRYLHPVNGVDPATGNPGFATWPSTGFDDSAWATGTGTFSYGGFDAPVLPGSVALISPPSGSRYTSYFRAVFPSPVSGTVPLQISLYCDDGAVIYINGIERGRVSLLNGAGFLAAPDTYKLLPDGTTVHAEGDLLTADLGAVPLQAGANTLAVSVHNSSATSSDLGFRLDRLETSPSAASESVPVLIHVADADIPPVGQPDSYSVPHNAPFLSSDNSGAGLLDNDGLYAPDGLPYDPVTALTVSAATAGALTLQGNTGHFRYDPPADFTGTVTFTYQITDKDGTSSPVTVTLQVQPPSGPFDLWRSAAFGGTGPGTLASDDADGDGWTNLLEYTLGTDPAAADRPAAGGFLSGLFAAAPPRPFVSIQVRRAPDLAWWLESTADPALGPWQTILESRGMDYLTPPPVGVSTRTPSAGAMVIDAFGNPADAVRQFYRLRSGLIPPRP